MNNQLNNNKNQSNSNPFPWSHKVSLLVLILLFVLIFWRSAAPYLSGLLGAFTLYMLLRGQMIRLVERRGWRKSIAATALLLEALLFFVVPLFVIIMMLVDVLSNAHVDLSMITAQVDQLQHNIEAFIGIKFLDLDMDFLKELPKWASGLVQALVSNIYLTVMNSFVMLFVLYFMLTGYEGLEETATDLLPFESHNKTIVTREVVRLTRSNAIGIPLMAIVQGSFAYAGYVIWDIPSPMFWGIMTAFATIVPLAGTMMFWIPLVIVYLFVPGDIVGGVWMSLYCFFIVGGSENVARLLLQKQLADTHPLVTVFGVIMGLVIFGFWGVIFGPLLLSLLVLFIKMYRYEYISGSKAVIESVRTVPKGSIEDKLQRRHLTFRRWWRMRRSTNK